MSLSLENFFLKGSKIIACEEVILRFVEREYLRRSQRYELKIERAKQKSKNILLGEHFWTSL